MSPNHRPIVQGQQGPYRYLVFALCGAILAFGLTGSPSPPRSATPIQVKVVVVAMFEAGKDTGDKPGELQYWVEHDHLDTIYQIAGAYHPARMNREGELAIVTGPGTAHAAATIMALGLDPRFDLSRAYWVIAGIAGGSPENTSLGSAVWANWIVDGDLRHEIDEKEMPEGWQTGIVPLGKQEPFQERAAPMAGQVYRTNRRLTQWAYRLTKDLPLKDSEELREIRSHFDAAAAQRPPQVLVGDEVSSSSYWHGKLMDAWARRWMSYFTGGEGQFATTAMEDSGTLQSLQLLARAGRVDWDRVLVLRTVSNFDQQPAGMDAAASLASMRTQRFGAEIPALQSAYTVGHAVVAEILRGWRVYGTFVP